MRLSLTHNRFAVVLLAALITALPLHAIGQHHKREAREEIGLLEAQWREAQLSDDVPAMDKLLSDDYLGITTAGEVVTKAQQLDRMRAREITLTRVDVSDVKIKLLGTRVAIVNALAAVQGTSDQHPLNSSFRFTRVYQRLPSGVWKITSFEPTRVTPGRRNQGPAQASNESVTPPSSR